MREADFTAAVLELARLGGWRTLHLRPAQFRDGRWATHVAGDGVGFPDLLMVRRDRMIAAELKVGRRPLTSAQATWLRDLAGAGVETHVWRPQDWAAIERVLLPGKSA